MVDAFTLFLVDNWGWYWWKSSHFVPVWYMEINLEEIKSLEKWNHHVNENEFFLLPECAWYRKGMIFFLVITKISSTLIFFEVLKIKLNCADPFPFPSPSSSKSRFTSKPKPTSNSIVLAVTTWTTVGGLGYSDGNNNCLSKIQWWATMTDCFWLLKPVMGGWLTATEWGDD